SRWGLFRRRSGSLHGADRWPQMAGYLYGLCGFRGLLARAARGGGALARPEQLVALGGAQHRAYRLVLVRQDHPRIRRGYLEGVVSRACRARRRVRRFAELLLILAGLSGNRFVPVSLRPIASAKGRSAAMLQGDMPRDPRNRA